MNPRNTFLSYPAIVLALLFTSLAALIPISEVNAASTQQRTIDIPVRYDTAVIPSQPQRDDLVSAPHFVLSERQPNTNPGLFDHNFLWFNISHLPANIEVVEANVELYVDLISLPTGVSEVEVEFGVVTEPWVNSSPFSFDWDSQPTIAWSGKTLSVTEDSTLTVPITPIFARWFDGSAANNGLAFRGVTPQAKSRSFTSDSLLGIPNSFHPRLVLTYRLPFDGSPYADLGDAPDSSNHHGIDNFAYPGIQGNFPTVWQAPSGAVAGPRHHNEDQEAILGNFITGEADADLGSDVDGPNNILRDASGVVIDVADQDRGDDGWRNQNLHLIDCSEQMLTVRVSKALTATKSVMFLNVWFDGNRDGDWSDVRFCTPSSKSSETASFEWIVQDHPIQMANIPAGGHLDMQILTEHILNATPNEEHWMRFSLSEHRAVDPPTGYPDGRGLHPIDDNAPNGSQYGETEDLLQLPSPQGDVGELILEKTVIVPNEPVLYEEIVRYEVRLRHEGGTQPIRAEISDEIVWPSHVVQHINSAGDSVVVDVTSPTGGVSPLEADYLFAGPISETQNTIVHWEGTLAPDAEVLLIFDVISKAACKGVLLPPPVLNTVEVVNVVEAGPIGESTISAEAGFVAGCFAVFGNQIEVELGEVFEGDFGFGNDDGERPPDIGPTLIGTAVNRGDELISVGVVQKITVDRPDNPDDGLEDNPDGSVTSAAVNMTEKARFLGRFALDPNESIAISAQLAVDPSIDESIGPQNDAPFGELFYCILLSEDDVCLDQVEYPDYWGEIELPHIPRRADLGDAPDSTNHDGTAMTAYPGIQADFPTVFDPATGLPPGPRHLRPWFFHLGLDVSNEVEADIGPDADGVNNIDPAGNTPNQDWFDDGSALTLQGPCQPALADVEINVSPTAKQYFNSTNPTAYLNIWLDWSYDGDWDDLFPCTGPSGQSVDVPEHILIDYEVDVTSLITGTNSITDIVTSRVPWPEQFNDKKRWVRFTLSDEPSNKTLSYSGPNDQEMMYGDGRGYQSSFKSGETEDYLWDLRGIAEEGPDIIIRADGKIRVEQSAKDLFFQVNYANIGSLPAENAILTLTKTEPLRNVEVRHVAGMGIDPNSVTNDANTITVPLPTIAVGDNEMVLLHVGPIADPAVASAAAEMIEELAVTAQIAVVDDLNERNNEAIIRIPRPNRPLRLAATVDSDSLWRKADTTCRSSINLVSRGEPLAEIDLKANGVERLQGMYDANGEIVDAQISELVAGKNLIWVDYDGDPTLPGSVLQPQSVQLKVDPALAVDPITLLLTDSQGRQSHPSTLEWGRGVLANYLLQSGERYQISIHSCGTDPNLNVSLMFGGERLATLRDDDGDGRMIGNFTYSPPTSDEVTGELQAAGQSSNELRLVIEANGVEQSIRGQVGNMESAMVRDTVTDQPIAGATITVLQNGVTTNVDPQTTDANGSYIVSLPNDIYQIEVAADGYQKFRSERVNVDSGLLAEEVYLSPSIAQPTDHTVYITAQGYSPSVVDAKLGDVIEWINADLNEHSANGDAWRSGHLASMSSYKFQFDEEGVYPYEDELNPSLEGGLITITSGTEDPVDEDPDRDTPETEEPSGGAKDEMTFLPLIEQP